MNEFAALLYDKVNNLEQEGLKIRTLCSRNTSHFSGCGNNGKVRPRSRTYMSSLYFFYADRVFKGLDTKKQRTGLVSSAKTILCQPIGLLASRPQLNQQTT
jgi:hypothetical protein